MTLFESKILLKRLLKSIGNVIFIRLTNIDSDGYNFYLVTEDMISKTVNINKNYNLKVLDNDNNVYFIPIKDETKNTLKVKLEQDYGVVV